MVIDSIWVDGTGTGWFLRAEERGTGAPLVWTQAGRWELPVDSEHDVANWPTREAAIAAMNRLVAQVLLEPARA